MLLASSTILLSGFAIFDLAARGRTQESSKTYLIADMLGAGEVQFTIPFTLSVLSTYNDTLSAIVMLLIFWVLVSTIKPVERLIRIAALTISRMLTTVGPKLGTIARVDAPNLVRVSLDKPDRWKKGLPVVARMADGHGAYLVPLFAELKDHEVVGTAYLTEKRILTNDPLPLGIGSVYETTDTDADIPGVGNGTEIIGFAIEGSSIESLVFEVLPNSKVQRGTLVNVKIQEQLVYYQVVEARSTEELIAGNPSGKTVAICNQLGRITEQGYLEEHRWIPDMNTPVVSAPADLTAQSPTPPSANDLVIGEVVGSKLPARADLNVLSELHCAVLGSTGSGKTELAFDIIRGAVDRGIKVICVDFTGDYRSRLADLGPTPLGLGGEDVRTLDELLFKIDIKGFRSENEKIDLKKFKEEKETSVEAEINKFIESGENLALFDFDQISNSKGSVICVELYLTCLMNWARNSHSEQQVLVAIEEAHLVIPETAGGSDWDVKWATERIGQIALQGRKYGVGLLLVSQRTALVSKTILSQCHTIFCFKLIDKTSLQYLESVVSQDLIRALPTLPKRNFFAIGSGVRGDRPLWVEVPHDPEKEKASRDARRKPVPRGRSATAVGGDEATAADASA
ncbi:MULTISPECIES: DUF87 domain-containing protein [Alphaproteobacteria]|uniref:ATP-binding protein n=1 Tax=Alphaproteobacteria TaxID=28211 RepID=UPI00329726BB